MAPVAPVGRARALAAVRAGTLPLWMGSPHPFVAIVEQDDRFRVRRLVVDDAEADAARTAALAAGRGWMPEARQYLALALVEADQDGDGVLEPIASDGTSTSVARALAYGRGHAGVPGRAVVALAADALVDEARYAEAEAIYDQLLAGDLTADERARVEASRRRAPDLRR